MQPLLDLGGDLYPQSLDCVHCGLCLTACPTYLATGRETSSPRGRVYLMRGVAEGRIGFTDTVNEELELCLGCRACETACPSGVQYGAMLERAREAAVKYGLKRGPAAVAARLALRFVVPRRAVLRLAVGLLRLVQRLSLDRLAARVLPASLAQPLQVAPRVPAAKSRVRLPEHTAAQGERRGEVAFLEGCIMPEVFGDVNRATVEVLGHNGFDVHVPPRQGCCGALAAHSGHVDDARSLARHNVAAFAAQKPGHEFAALVSNSAGCGAALREVGHWLPDGDLSDVPRAVDVCEWLDEVGARRPPGVIAARVCYDDPCHLVHAQGVRDAPRRLLEDIEGLVLVPHADADTCCGAAGIYNLTQPVMSARVLEAKLDALLAASPDIVATGNPGCMMQLRAGLEKRGSSIRVAHPVELLAEAWRAPRKGQVDGVPDDDGDGDDDGGRGADSNAGRV